ncbi:MAG: type II toxin-antitoxin system PemK/MazF family toxin [Pseudomonadota bacterium]
MALSFQPKVRAVVMCDFAGNIEPEMVKRRPVVVIARNRTNSKLVTIVPLSTTEPNVMAKHHYELPINPVPAQKGRKCWAKCDMVATVSLERMDRLKDGWNRVVPEVTATDLNAIRLGVVNALQLKGTVEEGRS